MKLLAWCPAILGLVGCSVGGNETDDGASPAVAAAKVHLVLGPISGADVVVRDLSGRTLGEGTSTSFSASRDTASTGSRTRVRNISEGREVGLVRFSRLDLSGLDDENLVVVTSTTGIDIDPDNDGLIEASEGRDAPEIAGGVGGIVRVADMKSGTVVLSAVSSLGLGASRGVSDSFDVIARLDRLSAFLLKGSTSGGDLNGDRIVNYRDLYAFDPSDHDFSTATATRRDDAALASLALIKRVLPVAGDSTTVSARLSAGGEANTPEKIALDFFGDSQDDNVADVFADPAQQDVDRDGTRDATDADIDGDGIPNADEVGLGYSPWNADSNGNGVQDGAEDSDGDGLSNQDEVVPPMGRPRTDPSKADTDGDQFNDKVEIDNGLNPNNGGDGPLVDSDGDSIPNGVEIDNGLNPSLAADGGQDLDMDGLANSAELNIHRTNIRSNDTDGDGFLDNEEVSAAFDPLDPADGGTADEDGDGISNALEVRANLNPRDASDAELDPDEDGLSNREEVAVHGTNPSLVDTDADGLDDRREVEDTDTDPLKADTDDDGRSDAEEVNDPIYPSNPRLADSDGDGLSDLLEAGTSTAADAARILLFDGTRINTSPTRIDSDGDGLSDPLEIKLQDQFRPYGAVQTAASLLRGALHPNNPASPAQLGGLQYLDIALQPSALEADPDGDGKPTIEELFHSTNPNDSTSEFLYVFESNAQGALNARRRAMDAAGMAYVPGGWDVDGNGSPESGFYVSRYEARSSNVPLSGTTDETTALGGSLIYSATTRTFSTRFCANASGLDSDNGDANGVCRGNRYQLADPDGRDEDPVPGQLDKAVFTPGAQPYVGLTWVEARLSALGSPIDEGAVLGGPYPVDLPMEVQWMQMVQLAVNAADNWTGGQVRSGAVYRGHSDGSPGSALAIASTANRFDGTGNSGSSGPDQKRTLVLRNGVRARDFSLPLSYSTEIWDLGGNAIEWTRGLYAANASTARPTAREGGERFANGLSEFWDYASGLNISGNTAANGITAMPPWLRPRLLAGTLLGSSDGIGVYYDGTPISDSDGILGSDGGAVGVDYGYGLLPYADGYVASLRGGSYLTGVSSGVSYLDLSQGLGIRVPTAGFRVAAPAQ